MAKQRARRRVEDSDEEEEESAQSPPRTVDKKPKAERVRAPMENQRGQATASRQETDDGGEAQEDDEDDDPEAARAYREAMRLVENFVDQPLPTEAARKITGIAGDWQSVLKRIKDSFQPIREIAVNVEEAADDDDCQEMKSLDVMMRELIDAEAEAAAHHDSLEALRAAVHDGTHQGNISEQYQQNVKRKVDAYKQQTARQKYGDHKEYSDFKEDIWEVNHVDEPMAPVKATLPREEGDEDSDDDDIVVGGATQDYKCPISLTLLNDPVTSTKCKHSFSKEAIYSLLASATNPPSRCPATGCDKIITKADLKPNKDLAKRVIAFARRQQAREDEAADQAEEVAFDDSDG